MNHPNRSRLTRTLTIIATLVLATAMLASCSATATPTASATPTSAVTPVPTTPPLSGQILIDGSSTVFPITQAVAEAFGAIHTGVQIPVAFAGTGGGFSKFAKGEIDINDASRTIKDSEAQACKDGGVEFTAFKVGYDGITVVVNPQNDWATDITTAELKAIWGSASTVTKWSDIRAGWPDQKIVLYGPGTASGTFDYFTTEINGKSGDVRSDYTPSEDDNVLVQGIAGDKYAMGFFGYSYYAENTDKLKELAVDAGSGPVTPTFDTIKDGSYSPLSRLLYIYVNNKALERPEVLAFVTYYLTEAKTLVAEVGYVPLVDADYTAELAKLA
jgi:phosphate transport system substrate-binding protein